MRTRSLRRFYGSVYTWSSTSRFQLCACPHSGGATRGPPRNSLYRSTGRRGGLPPLILTRGVPQKNRFIIAVGAIATVLTLVTNQPSLAWRHHTSDPKLLG